MPNHVILASGAVVAISVAAVATAVAIYESPEARRFADDIRRKIATAFHAIGDGFEPAGRGPRFNRPEDADGFFESRRGPGAEAGVDADEETRRRQREELLYWNSIMLEKQEKQEKGKKEVQASEADGAAEVKPSAPANGPQRISSFDNFLRQDESAERGTFVFNTGAEVQGSGEGLRRRGDGSRNIDFYANPFADEHHIDVHEIQAQPEASRQISPNDGEISDIYSAITHDHDEKPVQASPAEIDPNTVAALSETASSITLENELELGPDQYMTAGQEDRAEAYASIQAWAQNSTPDFYSPLPVTPTALTSEPEVLSDDGMLTPTDSMSLVGPGDDVTNDIMSLRDGEGSRHGDAMSKSSGMTTPASWSEIGSVISESDDHLSPVL